jgi:negative regulator of replication initiation
MDFDQIDANESAKEKFLFVLGEVYREKKSLFHNAFSVKEIFENKEEVPREPSQVPGSPHWAETNISTPQKAAVLFRVLDFFEYSEHEMVEALRLVIYKPYEWWKR